jgi:hypothetical protein
LLPVAPEWSTRERETEDGAVESHQWAALPRGLVTPDERGARALGARYLGEVTRFSRGLVRARRSRDGIALVLAGLVPLLRFGPPELAFGHGSAECRYPIRAGLLVARPGGSLLVAQRPGGRLELHVAGYFPRLGGGRPLSVRRVLYAGLQARAHRAVGRRFFEHAAHEMGA